MTPVVQYSDESQHRLLIYDAMHKSMCLCHTWMFCSSQVQTAADLM